MQTSRNVHSIPRERAIEFLTAETQGRIFSAYFRKKDGSMRNIVARRGVHSYLRGGELPYDPSAHQLLTVFDVQKRDYRTIGLDNLVSFNIGGETFILA